MSETVELKIADGKIEGLLYDGIAAYLGIPYGRPPVGELRWRPPQPAEPWEDVRDCTFFGPSCVQGPRSFQSAMYPKSFRNLDEAGYSEDCLNLNVWTKNDSREGKPVIVFFHGGAFAAGGSSAPVYDGTYLASLDVVFVSVNFRLGIFGLFVHPELAAESENGTAGNYMLMDQLLALKWVRNNIAAFGGDPFNVTVMGQSSGAASAEILAASPAARGLLKNAAVLSYILIDRPFPTQEEMLSSVHTELSIEELRSMPAEQLMIYPDFERNHWLPVVDNGIIPCSMAQLYASGLANNFNMMLGTVGGDSMIGGPFAVMDEQRPSASSFIYRVNLMNSFGDDLAPAVLALYPDDTPELLEESVEHLKRDNLQWLPYRTAKARAEHNEGSTYLYNIICSYPEREALGAFHGVDIPYWLGTIDYQPADLLTEYLVNFARTGCPESDEVPEWRPFDGHYRYLAVPDTDTNEVHEIGSRCDGFWENYPGPAKSGSRKTK